jgi:Ca2+-binding EF-hand superfamily protein
MRRLLSATALALTAGLAALPASAQPKPHDDRPAGASPSRQLRPDADARRSSHPPSAEARRCASNFKTLDKKWDRILAADELQGFEVVIKDVDRNRDGKITSAEFKSACAKGNLRNTHIRS